MLRKALIALGVVLVLQSVFALCLVSALQLLVLRNTPFGVTGASPVVNAVASKVSLETHSYADESAVMKAIGQSKLYGAYLPGKSSDTLVVVPAKSRRDIGPFLPPRNAYILLRNSIYFDGHGTTQALVVLLVSGDRACLPRPVPHPGDSRDPRDRSRGDRADRPGGRPAVVLLIK